MSSSAKPFMTVAFDHGKFAVVRTDSHKPQLLEVIAFFYDASRARDYADRESSRSGGAVAEPTRAQAKRSVEPTAATPELSPRQSAVLEALRAGMDENKQVAAKAAVLAGAAHIPLGSLHSVLQSLERKQLMKTVRAGSARAPAVYQIL